MGTTIINNFLTPKNVATPFIFRVNTAAATPTNQYRLPLAPNTDYDFVVDWGDGTTQSITTTTTVAAVVTKVYTASGFYNISISGKFPRIFVNLAVASDRAKITEVRQWGTVGWSSLEFAFAGCNNLSILPTDGSSLQFVTSFRNAFQNASSLTFFPPNQFDGWKATAATSCFSQTWTSTNLTSQSVENILVSIAASEVIAPVAGRDITISYNAATGGLTTATSNAIATLKSRLWVPRINGVLV